MNFPKISKKTRLKIRSLLRLSPKKRKAYNVLTWTFVILLFIDFFVLRIGQKDLAALLLFLGTIPIALAVLLYVPNKVLIRYIKKAGTNYKKFAVGTILLMCLDISTLIGFLYFIEGFSLGLNVDVELVPYVTIAGPIFEELIFRLGIIGGLSWFFNWFAKRQSSRWNERKIVKVFLIAVSAITFGLAHMFDIIKRTPQVTALITFGGAIYGFAYLRYGLGSSILLHATYNIFAVLL
jgi:membrane protease YdiL (CAAX protease family)